MHFHCHKDKGVSFVKSLDNKDVDVLLIAGDMGEQSDIEIPLSLMCDKFKRVVRVNGNHEFYQSSKEDVVEQEKVRTEKYSNYDFLENRIIKIGGKRIIGCTLWYRYVPMEMSRDWSDFGSIPNLSSWIWDANKESIKFLENNVQEGDIVMTHFLPSEACIAPQFKGNEYNVFFMCDMEELILEKKPALWLHGHTHTAIDKVVGSTRIVCNPLGYIGYENNSGFKDFSIDI